MTKHVAQTCVSRIAAAPSISVTLNLDAQVALQQKLQMLSNCKEIFKPVSVFLNILDGKNSKYKAGFGSRDIL